MQSFHIELRLESGTEQVAYRGGRKGSVKKKKLVSLMVRTQIHKKITLNEASIISDNTSQIVVVYREVTYLRGDRHLAA